MNSTTTLAGCALGTAGLYAFIGLCLAGSSAAMAVLLITVPVGGLVAALGK